MVVCSGVALYTATMMGGVREAILGLSPDPAKRILATDGPLEIRLNRAMTTLTSSWKDKDNITHEVETERNPGESAEDHSGRHKTAVEALKDLFPPA